jgi:signal transduction histidine kinase
VSAEEGHLRSQSGWRRYARWLVVIGFIAWSLGIALWERSWLAGLLISVLGGAMLTLGLDTLARGTHLTSAPVWGVDVPVAVSLVLLSLGASLSEFSGRVMLISLGTLAMIVVFLRVLDDRISVEKQLAQRSLVDARRRLAGEVHDVVGHTLSASMLHTSAARLSVRSDPDAAIVSLTHAEQQARRSMADIRSVVRLLRDDTSAEPPIPLTGDIDELVRTFQMAGADIAYRGIADFHELGSSTALTVYRVVQESLTNAVRHGSGTITVDVRRNPSAVEVHVANDRPMRQGATNGSGLIGMRERVEAVGGTVRNVVGADRWELHASVPT